MRFAVILAFVLTCSAAAPAAAGQGQEPPSNHPGSRRDFLFGRPHGSIGVHRSWLLPRAGSDLFDFVTDQLTIERADFRAAGIGLRLGVVVTPRLEAVAGVEFHKSRTPSEYRRSTVAARQAVPLQMAEVPEAAALLVPSAVEAALVETAARFPLTADRIVELSDAGVPGRIIDLMIALSFPRHFVIERRTVPQPSSARGRLAGGIGTAGWYDAYGFPYHYAPFAGYWGYDTYYYGAPVFSGPVTVQPQPSGEGRVVDGLGYTRVRSRDPIGVGTMAGSGGAASGGDGGASSGGGVTSQGYSGGGGDSGRTAVSRPPG